MYVWCQKECEHVIHHDICTGFYIKHKITHNLYYVIVDSINVIPLLNIVNLINLQKKPIKIILF